MEAQTREYLIEATRKMLQREEAHLAELIKLNAPSCFIATSKSYVAYYKKRIKEYSSDL
ncbi:MAG: hypothetical protein KDD50_16700 [Bdellovibrionales bacterium]|nr:hypothetical protein [Bdellovibrionales bacterium]